MASNMKAKIKDKWITALRSGKYAQAQGELRGEIEDEDGGPDSTVIGYCCLGVLLDIEHPNGWTNTFADGLVHRREAKSNQGFPSSAFLEEVGMTREQAEELASLNDAGYDFEFIAQAIERDL